MLRDPPKQEVWRAMQGHVGKHHGPLEAVRARGKRGQRRASTLFPGKGLAEGRLAWGWLVGITSADSGAWMLSLGVWSPALAGSRAGERWLRW